MKPVFEKNIIIDPVDSIQSVSAGLFIIKGPVDETHSTRGYSHFFEHMLFKGTKKRTGFEISREIERFGGQFNGYTTHEFIALYAKVPYYGINKVIEIFDDMICNSLFDKGHIKIEKNVVLEEILTVEDEPESLVYQHYMTDVWKNTPLEHPILGYENVIKRITKKSLAEFNNNILNSRKVLSLCGNVSDFDVDNPILKRFLACDFIKQDINQSVAIDKSAKKVNIHKYGGKGCHAIVGFPIPQRIFDDLYNMSIYNAIMVDGMSSRLFQKLREEYGLVYDICHGVDILKSYANYSICFSCSQENYQKVTDIISEEIASVIKNGFSEEEIDFARSYIKGSLLLNLEKTTSRMSSSVKDMLYFNRKITVEEKIEKINKVTNETVMQFASNFINLENMYVTALVPDEDGKKDE